MFQIDWMQLLEERKQLAQARDLEDRRIIDVNNGYDDRALTGPVNYSSTSGKQFQQQLSEVLSHLSNHQTHHRAQAHSCLSISTGQQPPSLDFLVMQRGVPAPDIPA